MLFWGLHPTNMTHVKCDHVPIGAQGVPIPMPLQLATLYTKYQQPVPTQHCQLSQVLQKSGSTQTQVLLHVYSIIFYISIFFK